MKILSVIPARAGSRGIPNKNIRIVNGKPLIAYCIENAIKSKYITDIIITTDSPEIELIARYYSIKVIHRAENLCGDAVTLDAVIYDACRDYPVDYVLTLQPTSPTLLSNTLDEAIEYVVYSGLDTLISVVNRPHLAWVEKDGNIVPDYQQRLNRQYLPKRFLETGAFLISKYNVVSEYSRIGEKVDVFEISEIEAIDIDNFQDLISAENVLRGRKIAIIVNGNNVIGMGHIHRMLELSDLFFHKPDIYFDPAVTDRSSFGGTTYKLITYDDPEHLLQLLINNNYQIIINDILDTNEEYVKSLKQIPSTPFIVNFEDTGDGRAYADLVFNALYQEKELRNNNFSGERFYLIPKLFLLYKPIEVKRNVENIFICFGGADPVNYTEDVLSIICQTEYVHLNFTVVLGRAKKEYKKLLNTAWGKNVTVLYDVKNMAELMSHNDIAITSRGRTCYELASLGIPTITVSQNEREEMHPFPCDENGFIYLGKDVSRQTIRKALNSLISADISKRKSMQERMLKHDLKSGRERIKNLIYSL
nr:hypothetical protein [uncultured Desulfobacter sp.]